MISHAAPITVSTPSYSSPGSNVISDTVGVSYTSLTRSDSSHRHLSLSTPSHSAPPNDSINAGNFHNGQINNGQLESGQHSPSSTWISQYQQSSSPSTRTAYSQIQTSPLLHSQSSGDPVPYTFDQNNAHHLKMSQTPNCFPGPPHLVSHSVSSPIQISLHNQSASNYLISSKQEEIPQSTTFSSGPHNQIRHLQRPASSPVKLTPMLSNHKDPINSQSQFVYSHNAPTRGPQVTSMQQQQTYEQRTPVRQSEPSNSSGMGSTIGAVAGGVGLGLLGDAVLNALTDESNGEQSWNIDSETTTYTETITAGQNTSGAVEYSNGLGGSSQYTEYDVTQYRFTDTVTYDNGSSNADGQRSDGNSLNMGQIAHALGQIAQHTPSNNNNSAPSPPYQTQQQSSGHYQQQGYAGNNLQQHQFHPSGHQFHAHGHQGQNVNNNGLLQSGSHPMTQQSVQQHQQQPSQIHNTETNAHITQQSTFSNALNKVGTEIASRLAVKAGVAVGGALIGAVFSNN